MGADFEAEGLLDGVEGEARRARVELLEQLEADGFSLEELKRATAEGRLALLPVERALEGEGRRYDVKELVEATGLDRELLLRLWRAMGMPEPDLGERQLTEGQLEAARAAARFVELGIGEESVLENTRVISQAMSSVAGSVSRTFAEALLQPGDTERDVAFRFADATHELVPLIERVLLDVLNLHLRQRARAAVLGSSELAAGAPAGAVEQCIGFVDLVGFTKLGERLPADQLGGVAGRLAELAADVAQPPVELVKTIGDAAMLVSPRPDALLDAALELVEAAEREGEGFPRVHAGVDRGEALQRAGDWYGAPVNRASRITGFARPGSVVASKEVREATDEDGYSWSFAGKRRLKGVGGELTLFRVRPAAEEG